MRRLVEKVTMQFCTGCGWSCNKLWLYSNWLVKQLGY